MHVSQHYWLISIIACSLLFFSDRSYGIATVEPTPLHKALSEHDYSKMYSYLQDPQLINAPTFEGYTPLHLAVLMHEPYLVEKLLKHGADPHKADRLGNTPLHYGVTSPIITSLLLENGANPLQANVTGELPLHRAAGSSLDSFMILVDAGSPITASTAYGKQPIHFAAESGQLEMLAYLLSHKIDKNGTDESGNTPLHYASDLKSAELLYLAGAAIDQANKDGATPLQYAVMRGMPELVLFLLEHNANPNTQNDTGATPLSTAVGIGNPTIVKHLLTYNANPLQKNDQGLTPLDQLKEELMAIKSQEKPLTIIAGLLAQRILELEAALKKD